MIARQRVHQCGRLLIKARVRLPTERGCLRAGQRCPEQAEVPYPDVTTEHVLGHAQQVAQRQVDHSASRRSASAYRGTSSSSTRSSRSARLCCSTYSRIACRATSCMERPSSAARWRSASDSSSLSRKVIATHAMIPVLIPQHGELRGRLLSNDGRRRGGAEPG